MQLLGCEEGVLKQLGLDIVPRGRFKGVDSNEDNYKLPGDNNLFAAGDVTNAYAEQVLIAVGEGAKAALSAYDYLLPQL